MPKCPICVRRLKYWQLKCRSCRVRIWRMPHYVVLGILIFGALALLLGFEIL